MLPGSLALERRHIPGSALIFDRRLRVDEDAGQLVQPVGRGRVVAPKPALRLESRRARVLRSGPTFLDVHESGRPLSHSDVDSPAIEMEVQWSDRIQGES